MLKRTLLVVAVLATALPVAHATEGLSLEIQIVGSATVKQGAPFRFKATVTNRSSSTAEPFDIRFQLKAANSPAVINAVQWTDVAEPTASRTFVGSLTTSTWFPQRGDFILKGATPDVTDSVRFEVTRAPVRVPRFRDVTEGAGLTSLLGFYECGTLAAGAAWGDIDGDRDLDLYVGGGTGDYPARLWINTQGQFTDEAEARGISSDGGLGAVFADYDNDGDQDLYVAGSDSDHLYRNDASGHFEDVTATAGVDVPGASQSATWGDVDSDGHLDLYVTNWGPCTSDIPSNDKLFFNNGDGTFRDGTAVLEATASTTGAGFQTAFFDYDMDGDLDIYLGNDYWGSRPEPNVMWENKGLDASGQVTFENVSNRSNTGIPLNTMGIGIGDYDRDLDLDMALSNIRSAALFRNDGAGTFARAEKYARVDRVYHDATSLSVTWGTFFSDLNNDGWEDLYFAAGRLASGEVAERDSIYQPNILYSNARNGRFFDHSAPSRADDTGTSRGVAVADYDVDGRVDLFVVNQDGTPRLYRNTTSQKRAHWLEVDTIGTTSNRDGCGARLVAVVGRAKLLRQVMCGGTSLSTGSDSTVHFGLGRTSSVDRLKIYWPSGIKQVLLDVKADRLIRVRERTTR